MAKTKRIDDASLKDSTQSNLLANLTKTVPDQGLCNAIMRYLSFDLAEAGKICICWRNLSDVLEALDDHATELLALPLEAIANASSNLAANITDMNISTCGGKIRSATKKTFDSTNDAPYTLSYPSFSRSNSSLKINSPSFRRFPLPVCLGRAFWGFFC